MDCSDRHEATFLWPEIDPQNVIVTGTFDQWSSSIHLTRTPRGFEGKVKLPWGERTLYKFVVDGQWRTAQSQPEEMDNSGNLNNVYECPSKPQPPTVAQPTVHLPPAVTKPKREGAGATEIPASVPAGAMDCKTSPKKVSEVVQEVEEPVVPLFPIESPRGTSTASDEIPILDVAKNGASDHVGAVDKANGSLTSAVTETSQTALETTAIAIAEVQAAISSAATAVTQTAKDTLVNKTPGPVSEKKNDIPRDIHASGMDALGFVASNLGIAVHALTGVDPLNPNQIPVETPSSMHDVRRPQPDIDPSARASISPREVDIELRSENTMSTELTPAVTASEPAQSAAVATHAPTRSAGAALTPAPPHAEVSPVTSIPDEGARTAVKTRERIVPTASSMARISDGLGFTGVDTIASSAMNGGTAPTPPKLAEVPAIPPAAMSEIVVVKSFDAPTASPPRAPSDAPLAHDMSQSDFQSTPALVANTLPESKPVQTDDGKPPTSATAEVKPAETALPPSASGGSANGHPSAPANPSMPSEIQEVTEATKPQISPTNDIKPPETSTSIPEEPSKFSTTRKKRLSIFGKIKNIFHPDKEDKKEQN